MALLRNYTALAQVVAPSQGGEVGLVLVTSTTMELTFGTTGNGQGRVVAMAPTSSGMPVPLSATDGNFYSASPAYGKGNILGSGYAVYSGAGHSVTVTGLKPSTYYYISSAEYNTDGSAIAYNNRSSSISTSTHAAAATATPLPVELISFTGTLDTRNMATLRWSTATEHNTAYFALERSFNGVSFTEVGQVQAAGTSGQTLAYRWSDSHPLSVATYYRLRQVDRDSSLHYSSPIILTPLSQATRTIEVYPNPGTSTTINLLMQGYEKEVVKLLLTNTLGQLVSTQTLMPPTTYYAAPLTLPNGLATGTYFLTLIDNNRSFQKRITIE